MKFLVLGATGMAGHVIAIYLKEQGYEVEALTRKPFPYCKNIIADVTNLPAITEIIKNGRYNAVINCIGILNQFAEENKDQAVFVNSYLPHYLSYITKETDTQIIHMSTDCVFSGKTGNYSENSLTDGDAFYDRSKALGELDNDRDLTFRNSIIGPDINKDGIGLFNWFMKQNTEISGFRKAVWTGVTTLTLAKAIEKAIDENITGLYHLVNNQTINKFELLNLFNKNFKDNLVSILPSDTVVVNKSLINNRKDFSFEIPSYEQMIIEMKKWIFDHKEIYKHYFI